MLIDTVRPKPLLFTIAQVFTFYKVGDGLLAKLRCLKNVIALVIVLNANKNPCFYAKSFNHRHQLRRARGDGAFVAFRFLNPIILKPINLKAIVFASKLVKTTVLFELL